MTTTSTAQDEYTLTTVEGDTVTPVRDRFLNEMTRELETICDQSDDPQSSRRVILELVPKFAAETALNTLLSEHDLDVVEVDLSSLGKLGDKLLALHYDAIKKIAVPVGQDPVERLHAVRRLLTELGATS